MENFNEEQLNLISEFRNCLIDLNEDKEYGEIYLNENSTLWRYILAKSNEENSLSKSEIMLRESIKWRKEINIKNLLNNYNFKENYTLTLGAKFGKLCFTGWILNKKTKNNGPIMIERIGKLDLYELSRDQCNYYSYLCLFYYYFLIFIFIRCIYKYCK